MTCMTPSTYVILWLYCLRDFCRCLAPRLPTCLPPSPESSLLLLLPFGTSSLMRSMFCGIFLHSACYERLLCSHQDLGYILWTASIACTRKLLSDLFFRNLFIYLYSCCQILYCYCAWPVCAILRFMHVLLNVYCGMFYCKLLWDHTREDWV